MKIVAKEFPCSLIYEHRQLFSNEVEYNSLYLSNLMGYNVDLLDIEDYKKLDIKTRHQISHNTETKHIHFISGSGIIVLIYTDNISVNYTWDEFFYFFVRHKPNSYIITIIKEHS